MPSQSESIAESMRDFHSSQIPEPNDSLKEPVLNSPTRPIITTFTFGATQRHSRSVGPDEVHVWRIDLNRDLDEGGQLLAVFSADERARAARYRFDKHRDDFIESRAALRSILGAYAGVAAVEVEFNYGQNGKPQLAPKLSNKKLQFSFSKREGLALVAIANDREVGIDLEFLRDDFPTFEFAEDVFSPHEFEEFRRLPAEQRSQGFYNCWTRKEAYVKAIGAGLSFPLKQFDVSVTPTEPALLLRVEGGDPGRWMLEDLQVGENYIAALAVALRN